MGLFGPALIFNTGFGAVLIILKRAIYFFVVFNFLCPGAVFAEEEALKIGFVNVGRVIENAPQGGTALQKLEEEFGPRDREIRSMREEVEKLEEELLKNDLVLDDTARNKKELELRDKRRALRRATSEFREDYNLRRNEELNALQKVVIKAIVEIAKDESYDLIVHEPAVVFASDQIDMTERVLEQLRAPGE
ncbi:MAG: Chaperone protein Skp [Gammaproteobacteria bacterium]|nr:Chaperone protein Skp [Gammaproteobacteria bacterium]